MNVAIIDYGSGNLRSASKACARAAADVGLAVEVTVTSDPRHVLSADRIVLPGVGAFADCRNGLKAVDGMWEALNEAVRTRATPFLGICVGMQLMATRGLEFGVTEGLGWIAGEVHAIAPADPVLKVPHMGWNTLTLDRAHPVFEGLALGPEGLHAYFVHSYHLVPDDPGDILAHTDYGGPVTAAVARDTMVATQFHPEKSQRLGLGLLANFLRWTP